jgi:hypothetical protein
MKSGAASEARRCGGREKALRIVIPNPVESQTGVRNLLFLFFK